MHARSGTEGQSFSSYNHHTWRGSTIYSRKAEVCLEDTGSWCCFKFDDERMNMAVVILAASSRGRNSASYASDMASYR